MESIKKRMNPIGKKLELLDYFRLVIAALLVIELVLLSIMTDINNLTALTFVLPLYLPCILMYIMPCLKFEYFKKTTVVSELAKVYCLVLTVFATIVFGYLTISCLPIMTDGRLLSIIMLAVCLIATSLSIVSFVFQIIRNRTKKSTIMSRQLFSLLMIAACWLVCFIIQALYYHGNTKLDDKFMFINFSFLFVIIIAIVLFIIEIIKCKKTENKDII